MARIKIALPAEFKFSTQIPVRITDLNYGGHMGNDSLLAILHEARMQYLSGMGFSETDFAGAGLIMADAGIEFKAEAFFADILTISIAVADISSISFDLYYKVEKSGDTPQLVAKAKTGMVCFDYTLRKVISIPEEALAKIR